MALRNHSIESIAWLNPYEFTCVYRHQSPYMKEPELVAGYGWVRKDKPGASFAMYRVVQGHIDRLGVMKRDKIPLGLDNAPVVL